MIFGRQAEEASGTGTIAGKIDIPVGSEITYTITGTLAEDTAASSVDLTLSPDQVDLFMSELRFVIERNTADINQNVDFADFLILSSNFGQDVTPQEQGDIDGDGSVSFTDFLLLSAQFGQTP